MPKLVHLGETISGGGGGSELKFVGTQAEWDALSADEKAVYEGLQVIITDDYANNQICSTLEECITTKNPSSVAGAKAVAEVTDKIPVFKGTREEFDNLSDATKQSYDGKQVIITDDYDSNICSSIQECIDSTNVNDVAGASVVKELSSSLESKILETGITGLDVIYNSFCVTVLYSNSVTVGSKTWLRGIFTIPSIKPKTDIRFPVYNTNNGTWTGFGKLNTDGSFDVYNSTSASVNNVAFNVTYTL